MLPTTHQCPKDNCIQELDLVKVNDLSTGGSEIETYWCRVCEQMIDKEEVESYNEALKLFPGISIDSKHEEVKNRFTGEAALLPPIAVAVYDVIMGSEILGISITMRHGLDWFIRYYPEEYMTLLD